MNEGFNLLDCGSLQVDSRVRTGDAIDSVMSLCFNCQQLYLHEGIDALWCQLEQVCFRVAMFASACQAVVVIFTRCAWVVS